MKYTNVDVIITEKKKHDMIWVTEALKEANIQQLFKVFDSFVEDGDIEGLIRISKSVNGALYHLSQNK